MSNYPLQKPTWSTKEALCAGRIFHPDGLQEGGVQLALYFDMQQNKNLVPLHQAALQGLPAVPEWVTFELCAAGVSRKDPPKEGLEAGNSSNNNAEVILSGFIYQGLFIFCHQTVQQQIPTVMSKEEWTTMKGGFCNRARWHHCKNDFQMCFIQGKCVLALY